MPEFVYPLIGISLIFICTTLGALLVFFIRKKEISPKWNIIFMGFAAGCMIYVVAEEMIPKMASDGQNHYGVWAFFIGFVVMLALDCIQI